MEGEVESAVETVNTIGRDRFNRTSGT
jgi:hypothetical protein